MIATLLALPLLSLAALAEPHGHVGLQRHHNVGKRAASEVHTFEKRFSGARWSFYDAGQVACGGTNTDDGFTVAINSIQYGGGYPGPQCGKSITMQYNGKTAQATIVDECPGCPYGGLDLTRGLFKHFASEDDGIIYGEWWFNDGDNGGGQETTTKKPDPTTTREPETTWTPDPTTSKTKTKTTPTTTWEPETTSWTPEPTTEWTSTTEEKTTSTKKSSSSWSEPSSSSWSSSSSSSESSSSSSATPTSTSSSSSSATPTPTPSATAGIELLGQAVLGMGNFMVAVAV